MDRHGNLANKERAESLSTRLRKVEPEEKGELLYEEPVSSNKPMEEERLQHVDAAYEYLFGPEKHRLSRTDIMMRSFSAGFIVGAILTLLAIYLTKVVF